MSAPRVRSTKNANAKQRADQMKAYLEGKYSKQKHERQEMDSRRKLLEDQMTEMSLGDEEKVIQCFPGHSRLSVDLYYYLRMSLCIYTYESSGYSIPSVLTVLFYAILCYVMNHLTNLQCTGQIQRGIRESRGRCATRSQETLNNRRF